MNLFKYWVVMCTSLFIVAGCATMRDSILTGIGTGAAGGAAVGNAVNPNDSSNTWKGAAIGGIVGGVLGYVVRNSLEKRDADIRRETLFNLEKYNVSRPGSSDAGVNFKVAPPNVETECFETEVRGNKLIQSHCEATIVGQPEWVLPSNQKRKSQNE